MEKRDVILRIENVCIHFLDGEKEHVVARIYSEMKTVKFERNAKAIKYREWEEKYNRKVQTERTA